MLIQIQVRNFTIVDQLDLDLHSGMTVLTGETGAGKSILLDALALALGARADTQTIRSGCERAEVAAEFSIDSHPNVKQWLKEQDLDADAECFIRRTINLEGKSKGFINGYPVAMQTLRELGEMLVDLHSQHAFQSLLKREYQRQALDDYGDYEDLINKVKNQYKQWKFLNEERLSLLKYQQEREARLELLEYQAKELADISLEENEYALLEAEFQKLSNLNKLLDVGQQSLYKIENDDDTSISRQLSQVIRDLETLNNIDSDLSSTIQLLNESNIALQEATNELQHYLDSLESDPQRLDIVNERITQLHDLSRKHHIKPHELLSLYNQLVKELEELSAVNEHSRSLDSDIANAQSQYLASATKLSEKRKSTAKTLAVEITKNMQHLGMKSGKFEVSLIPNDEFSQSGMEKIEFLVSTNPGEPLKSLVKVASGGELSRISLAIQVITASKGSIPTLIFDEVDVGIGGGTAEVVGHLLKKLSKKKQVLCVTHQPQVAAQAHYHLRVSKQSKNNITNTAIESLTKDHRTDEIARMLGGLNITKQTLSHAQEMINQAELEPIAD